MLSRVSERGALIFPGFGTLQPWKNHPACLLGRAPLLSPPDSHAALERRGDILLLGDYTAHRVKQVTKRSDWGGGGE